MEVSTASWLVVVLAIAAANLPFLNDKVLALIPTGKRKHFVLRLAEMAVLYFVVGGIGVALETHIGSAFPQTWEFYAITACFFVVLAFPGFVFRYLRKQHG
ncbi:MAG: DUF2818 family protein [Sphingomonadaceae bacterium]